MDETLKDPAEALLRTYSASGGINYLDAAATLPSRPAIDDACVELLSLLFPVSMASRSCVPAICPISPAAAFALCTRVCIPKCARASPGAKEMVPLNPRPIAS